MLPQVFDRIEIRRVGRKVENSYTIVVKVFECEFGFVNRSIIVQKIPLLTRGFGEEELNGLEEMTCFEDVANERFAVECLVVNVAVTETGGSEATPDLQL
jgi:hypothetical protein